MACATTESDPDDLEPKAHLEARLHALKEGYITKSMGRNHRSTYSAAKRRWLVLTRKSELLLYNDYFSDHPSSTISLVGATLECPPPRASTGAPPRLLKINTQDGKEYFLNVQTDWKVAIEEAMTKSIECSSQKQTFEEPIMACATTDLEVVKQGYITITVKLKHRNSFGAKRRWLVLTRKSELLFYIDSSSDHPSRAIPLVGATLECPPPRASTDTPPCILKIYTQDGKEYRLTTDNKETRDEWKVAIEEAMTKLVHILGQYEV